MVAVTPSGVDVQSTWDERIMHFDNYGRETEAGYLNRVGEKNFFGELVAAGSPEAMPYEITDVCSAEELARSKWYRVMALERQREYAQHLREQLASENEGRTRRTFDRPRAPKENMSWWGSRLRENWWGGRLRETLKRLRGR